VINIFAALLRRAKQGPATVPILANYLQSGPTIPYNTGLTSKDTGTTRPAGTTFYLKFLTGAIWTKKEASAGHLLKVKKN
jgi:hypothetical protein